MRRTVATAALALLAASLPARAATPVLLGGVTTVVAPAAASTHVAVRVPARVTLSPGYLDPAYVTFSGTADVVVLYLVPPRPRPLLHEPVMFARTQAATGRHVVAGFPSGVSAIEAGDYDLVLLHSPGTATARLALPGLRGSVTVTPRASSTAHLVALADATHAPVGSSGGAYGALSRTGFVQIVGVISASPGGVSHLTLCLKRPDDLTPPPVDFVPECPGLRTTSFVAVQGTTSFGAGTFLNYEPGTYGAGFGYEMAGLPTAVAGFATWVPV